jgi:hypothetical protein
LVYSCGREALSIYVQHQQAQHKKFKVRGGTHNLSSIVEAVRTETPSAIALFAIRQCWSTPPGLLRSSVRLSSSSSALFLGLLSTFSPSQTAGCSALVSGVLRQMRRRALLRPEPSRPLLPSPDLGARLLVSLPPLSPLNLVSSVCLKAKDDQGHGKADRPSNT